MSGDPGTEPGKHQRYLGYSESGGTKHSVDFYKRPHTCLRKCFPQRHKSCGMTSAMRPAQGVLPLRAWRGHKCHIRDQSVP
ncbi:hypothetical protein O3P69_010406 [Scylla paramamosain]|uniref:Uncharacterized protein n=1 Tax=Scylla paramamosain TaxID=85552 RepID=A0AAW0TT47_SCYPA